MSAEVKCIMGNGICPPHCPNHEAAKKITEELGDKFDPFMSRLAVVFGDRNPQVGLTQVCNAMANCVEEKLRKTPFTI